MKIAALVSVVLPRRKQEEALLQFTLLKTASGIVTLKPFKELPLITEVSVPFWIGATVEGFTHQFQPVQRSRTCGWRASHPKCSTYSGPAGGKLLLINKTFACLLYLNTTEDTSYQQASLPTFSKLSRYKSSKQAVNWCEFETCSSIVIRFYCRTTVNKVLLDL